MGDDEGQAGPVEVKGTPPDLREDLVLLGAPADLAPVSIEHALHPQIERPVSERRRRERGLSMEPREPGARPREVFPDPPGVGDVAGRVVRRSHRPARERRGDEDQAPADPVQPQHLGHLRPDPRRPHHGQLRQDEVFDLESGLTPELSGHLRHGPRGSGPVEEHHRDMRLRVTVRAEDDAVHESSCTRPEPLPAFVEERADRLDHDDLRATMAIAGASRTRVPPGEASAVDRMAIRPRRTARVTHRLPVSAYGTNRFRRK